MLLRVIILLALLLGLAPSARAAALFLSTTEPATSVLALLGIAALIVIVVARHRWHRG